MVFENETVPYKQRRAYTWQDGIVTCRRLREIPVICNRKKKKK